MKRLINILCVIGAVVFMAAAITAEAHWIASTIWCLAGALMMAPYLRSTYEAETQR